MIPGPDLDLESDFLLSLVPDLDLDPEKKQNLNTERGLTILALDPSLELDFPLGTSRSGLIQTQYKGES